jgi:Citrate transporter/TrkA-C domain
MVSFFPNLLCNSMRIRFFIVLQVLFVVAHGLTVTGAVDWYIGKLLGTPKLAAGAQLRLVIPVTIVSAFLNNTPIVAVMIPIVLRWARTIRVSASQLLIPLSYAAILGGTCTLIGTSTNLVVSGLLLDAYPNDPSAVLTLFDIAPYGVPVAIIGVAYIIVFGPFILPGGRSGGGGSPFDGDEILLGARITPWSPAAGRSVKRSGLRDTGGLYLVSVRRAATGNIHRAVGHEFVLNVGDIVYFSGLIEGFGDFCHEHGLIIVTNESFDENVAMAEAQSTMIDDAPMSEDDVPMSEDDVPVSEDDVHVAFSRGEIGFTKESLALSDEAKRHRTINLMTGTYQMVFLSLFESGTQAFHVLSRFRYYPRYRANRVRDGTRQ